MREDWIECKFDDVFFTTSGGTPSRRNENYYIGNIPWIKSGELKSNVITEAEEFISEEAVKNSSAKVFPAGTILLALYGATIGKIAILGIPAATNQAICGIFETPFVFSKYAYYYLVNKKSYLIKQGIGGAQPNISQTILKNLDFSLPPLPEQRAIVKKLESLFSSLDAGVADLKKAQQQLKIYRQAVLRKSLDAKKRVLISELIQNLSQGWSPKCLNENVENNEEWAVIKTTAIQHGEFLPYENKKLPTDLEPREQHQIEVGDILITRAGPRIRVGVCCLVRKTKLKLINCDKVYRIKLKDTVVLPEYFELVLNSPDYLKLINDIKTGSSDSGLNLTQDRFLKLEIPLPSIKEQIEIIKQIESRLSVCDSIEQNIKESLEKAEALRQSILKKAFEGNLLTAQELAECKLAEDYEPASVLLEKIKAEQTEIKAKPSKKKPRHSVAKSQ